MTQSSSRYHLRVTFFSYSDDKKEVGVPILSFNEEANREQFLLYSHSEEKKHKLHSISIDPNDKDRKTTTILISGVIKKRGVPQNLSVNNAIANSRSNKNILVWLILDRTCRNCPEIKSAKSQLTAHY